MYIKIFFLMVILFSNQAYAICENGLDQSSTIYNSNLSKYQRWARCNSSSSSTIVYQETQTSSNPLVTSNWSELKTVLSKGQTNSFDSGGVNYPSVILINNVYHMYYHGKDANSILKIGHATSSDGITWTKDANNPVLTVSDDSNVWDHQSVQSPTVIYENGTFMMWYAGNNSGNNQTNSRIRIGYASSTDGSNFKKSNNFVIDVGSSSSSWDSKRVVFPRVIKTSNGFTMFFSGDNYKESQCKNNTTGEMYSCHTSDYSYDLGKATSTDGITWSKKSTPIMKAVDKNFLAIYASEILKIQNKDEYVMFYSYYNNLSGPYNIKFRSINID